MQKVNIMYAVKLLGDIPQDKYQMAVALLRIIGLEVEQEETLQVPKKVLQEVEKGLEEAKNKNVIPSQTVHKQMQEYIKSYLNK